MRTPRTTASRTKATVSGTLVTAALGAGLLFGTSPAAAADSPYKAAVDQCRSTSTGAAALRDDCLRGVAPQRVPKIAKKPVVAPDVPRSSESGTSGGGGGGGAPQAAPAPAPAPAVDSGSAPGVWAQLRECEAGGDYGLNDGSGYYGAYQFDLSTWQSIGYSGYPNQASPEVQDEAARVLQSQRGWQPWPACSRKLGLR